MLRRRSVALQESLQPLFLALGGTFFLERTLRFFPGLFLPVLVVAHRRALLWGRCPPSNRLTGAASSSPCGLSPTPPAAVSAPTPAAKPRHPVKQLHDVRHQLCAAEFPI